MKALVSTFSPGNSSGTKVPRSIILKKEKDYTKAAAINNSYSLNIATA